MTDVTNILGQIEDGDPSAAEKLLPLVYEELRKLAAAKMAQEKPGQTLQATALVHEAYMRLVDSKNLRNWDSRGHFFSAAAEAMRRILIQNHRRKQAEKHGGGQNRCDLNDADLAAEQQGFDILSLSDAIDLLESEDPTSADFAKLRIFAGLSVDEAARTLGIPHTSAYRQWSYTQAWLRTQLRNAR
jgi:RNA polymerase sigma factor (TIGR02999 family)